jgi:hypothetical protein
VGDRLLPLVREDSDWDLVAARILHLVPELDDPAVIRVLVALDTALAASLPTHARIEAVALAQLALERLADLWRDRRATLPVAALEAWLALAARVPAPPASPAADRTWLELAQTDRVDVESREELVRFDEWLSLAGVLGRLAPRDLVRFGFPERHDRVFAMFVHDAAGRVSDDLEPLVTHCLRRLRRVAPAYAFDATQARWALAAKDDPWFEVRFETHPRLPEPVPDERVLVERVLHDLE